MRPRFALPAALVSASLALGACSLAQVQSTLSAGARFLDDPIVREILDKVVLPLLPLDSKELRPLLDKAYTAAEVVKAYQATFGAKVGDLPTTDLVKQISLQGATQFGILTETRVGLGAMPSGTALERLIGLILVLFELKGKGQAVEPTQVLTPIYGSSSQTTPTPAPSPGATAAPTPTPAPGAPCGAAAGQVDLRCRFGAVRSQGPRGTCNLFAFAQLMDYQYPDRGQHSPEFLDWIYNHQFRARASDQKKHLWNVDEGTYTDVISALVTPQGNPVPNDFMPYIPPAQGAVLESEAPYQRDLESSPTSASPESVAPRRLGADLAGRLRSGAALRTDLLQTYALKLDVNTLEKALDEGNPIRMSYPVRERDWQTPALRQRSFRLAELPSGRSAADNYGYHAVLLVGYRRDGSAPGGGWFLLRNSWGDDWGDGGYAWVSYQLTLDYAHEPLIARKVDAANTTTFSTAPLPDVAPRR
ncbi:MAG: C1 family peptidase [Candidatus Sericytochromatia bacterium]|nr:C1 family peptidase [Candidatus Tanganyikabacteria bacterium]